MSSSRGKNRFARDYGQREQFTRRIKNLLKDYPDGLSIPKELIQNSDDAKATETALMLDLRHHGIGNLKKSPLKDFRGPALVFFNNQTFSENDFDNLCKFGGETKLEDRKKVGKFGLGFNSVYNITDLPQFVSGNRLCILDPHEKYLGRRGVSYNLDEVGESEDGVLYKCCEDPEVSELLAPFENLFGYDPESVGNGKPFPGTIFRLPLRTAVNAAASEIRSGVEYTEQDAIDLLRMTSHYGSLLLLFTQHVEKFEIKVMSSEGGYPYSFEGSSWSREVSLDCRSLGVPRIPCSQILEQEEDRFDYTYEVALRRPQGEQKWLVSVAAPGPPKSEDGTLCVASVALCLSNPELDVSNQKHLLFCFLPIPQPDDTRLPFMVNGTFHVTSSRRQVEIHTMDDKSDQADWNIRILREAVPKALVEVLLFLETKGQDVVSFFPSRNAIEFTHCVPEEFYRIITTDSRTKFFETAAGSVSLADPRVRVLDTKTTKELRDTLCDFLQSFHKNNVLQSFFVISIDDRVYQDLTHFVPGFIQSRTVSLAQCLPLVFNNLSVDNILQVLPVLQYCLDHLIGISDVSHLFKSRNWILTGSQSAGLKKPDEVVHPHGKARTILADFPQYLINAAMDLDRWNRLVFLTKIGLKKDDLPNGAFSILFRSLLETGSDTTTKFKEIAQYLNTVQTFPHAEWSGILKVPRITNDGHTEWKMRNQFFDISFQNLVERSYPTVDLTSLGIPRNSRVDRVMEFWTEPPQEIVIDNMRLMKADTNLAFEDKVYQMWDFLKFISARSVRYPQFKEPCVPTTQGDFRRPAEVSIGKGCKPLEDLLFVAQQTIRQDRQIADFLQENGAQKSFSSNVYSEKLAGLEGTVVSTKQVNQIVSILKLLKTAAHACHDICIPDTRRKMVRATELCSGDTRDVPASVSLQLSHQSIPNDITEFLSIRTVKQAEQDLFDDPSVMDFGQEEQLSNRLRRIAEGYSSEIDIFKEMLQNADDAAAEVCHFVLDLRSGQSSSHIVNPGWEQLQEPAILVFNDSFFTQEDLNGLQQLGQGSKGTDVTKIGQYGVGFNCVYKITDTPSFVTQLNGTKSGILCVSDPLRRIVGNRRTAGVCLHLNQEYITSRWKDTLDAFLLDEFGVLDGKTMFRLPLRKQAGISSSIPTSNNMKSLFGKFCRELPDLILFLRSIKNIRVSVIEQNGVRSEVGSVSKEVSNGRLSNGLKVTNKELLRYASGNNDPLYLKYDATLRSHDGLSRNWKIVEQFGSTVEKPDFLSKRENAGFSKLKVHGTVAFRTDVALQKALVYCYLPVPHASHEMSRIDINLPVAVNAQFCLDENRRFIQLGSNNEDLPEVRWNEFIAREVIGECYTELIADEASAFAQSRALVDSYLRFLPNCDNPGNPQESLALFISQGLFKFLGLRNIPFVPILDENKHVSKMVLPRDAFDYPPSSAKGLIFQLAARLSLNVTRLEAKFCQFWRKCGSDVSHLNAQQVLDKLSELVPTPTPISDSPFRDSETLVQFLEFSKTEIKNHPDPTEIPVFLTQDDILRRANSSTNPVCSDKFSLSKVLPQRKDLFLVAKVEQLVPTQTVWELDVLYSLRQIENWYPELVCREVPEDRVVQHVDPGGIVTQNWIKLVWRYIASDQDNNALADLPYLALIPVKKNHSNSWKLLPFWTAKKHIFAEQQNLCFGTVQKSSAILDGFYHLMSPVGLGVSEITMLKAMTIGPRDMQSVVFQLDILHSMYIKGSFHIFTAVEKHRLLDHLARNSNSANLSPDQVVKLTRLPIFEALDGELVSIADQAGQCYSISDQIPRVGCLQVARSRGYTFFKANHKQFMSRLGVVNQEDSQFYIESLIPVQFAQFSEKDLFQHLRYLERLFSAAKNTGYSVPNLDKLSQALSETAFIHVVNEELDEELKRPTELYWPNPIFLAFCDADMLLQRTRYISQFPNLLGSLNFIKTITKESFDLFSVQLAEEMLKVSQEIPENLRMKADLLLKHVISNFRLMTRQSLTSFAALKMFQSDNMGVVCLQGSLLYEWSHLASECTPILAYHHSDVFPDRRISQDLRELLQILGIEDMPSYETVIENLRQMGIKEEQRNDPGQRSKGYIKRVETCVKHILTSRNNAAITLLKKTKCIPGAGPYILAPQQLTIEARVFNPGIRHKYLSSPSPKLELSTEMQQAMGVSDRITILQIQRALLTLHDDLSAIERNPNLQNLAREFTRSFCERLLYENEHPSAFISLYLLNSAGTLTDACELFLDRDCDSKFREVMLGEAILPLTIIVKGIIFRRNAADEIGKKLLKLPEAIRVRNFSEHVTYSVPKETLAESNIVRNQDLEVFTSCLNSNVFSQCLGIIVHNSRNELGTPPSVSESTAKAKRILSNLAGKRIILVNELKVEIAVIPGKEIPGLPAKVDVSRTRFSEPDRLIIQCSNSDVRSILLNLLEREADTDSKDDLKYLIFECTDDEQRKQWYEERSGSTRQTLPVHRPGDDVPFGMHNIINRDPFQEMPLGDLVAILVESSGERGEILKFAIVTEVIQRADPDIAFAGLYMVQTKREGNPVEISGINLFSFIQTNKQGEPEPPGTVSAVEESLDRVDRIVRAAFTNLPPSEAVKVRNRAIAHFMALHNDDEHRSMMKERIQNIQPPAILDADDDRQSPRSNYDVPAIPAVSEYIEQRNRQMTREVEAYQSQVRSYNASVSRWQDAAPRATAPPSFVQTRVTAPVGHPGKAQLQLNNAQSDLAVCERIVQGEDSGERTTYWTIATALKAIESSLKCVCLMQPTTATGFSVLKNNAAKNIPKLVDMLPRDFDNELKETVRSTISVDLLKNDKRLDDIQRQVTDERRDAVIELARRTLHAAEKIMN